MIGYRLHPIWDACCFRAARRLIEAGQKGRQPGD